MISIDVKHPLFLYFWVVVVCVWGGGVLNCYNLQWMVL
jgi:hypothetical protein